MCPKGSLESDGAGRAGGEEDLTFGGGLQLGKEVVQVNLVDDFTDDGPKVTTLGVLCLARD